MEKGKRKKWNERTREGEGQTKKEKKRGGEKKNIQRREVKGLNKIKKRERERELKYNRNPWE